MTTTTRPEMRHPPLSIECRCDGNQVYAMIGADPVVGVIGYGDTLPDALRELAAEVEREVGEDGSTSSEAKLSEVARYISMDWGSTEDLVAALTVLMQS